MSGYACHDCDFTTESASRAVEHQRPGHQVFHVVARHLAEIRDVEQCVLYAAEAWHINTSESHRPEKDRCGCPDCKLHGAVAAWRAARVGDAEASRAGEEK
jgi:hypothetical protein